jgi:hypothetical protein
MEILLNKEFEDACVKGRKVDDQWLIQHAKNLYCELYFERCLRHKNGT